MKYVLLIGSYLIAVILFSIFGVADASFKGLNNSSFNLPTIGLFALGSCMIFMPFMLLGILSYRNKKRTTFKAVSLGLLLWLYLVLIPGTLTENLVYITHHTFYYYLFYAIDFLIGVHLIYRFKLPKAYAIPLLLLEPFFILYLLIQGMRQNYSKY